MDDDLLLDLAIAPDGAIYAASQSGLLRSDEHGRSWQPCLEAEGVPVTAVAAAADGTVLASVPGGIGRSANRGETWTFVHLPEPAPMIAALACSGETALAATMHDGVFISADGGKTWTARNAGLLDHDARGVAIFGDALFVATSTGLFASGNGGLRWSPAGDLPELAALSALRALPGGLIAAVEDGGLRRSTDGATWSRLAARSLPDDLDLLIAHPTTGRLAALSDGAAFASDDGGETWRPALSLLAALASADVWRG